MAGEDAYERFVAPINLHGAKLRPMFVESERIAATIHKVAEDEKVDLKVISTRGRSRSAAILLGSVTEGVIVLTEVHCPRNRHPRRQGGEVHRPDAPRCRLGGSGLDTRTHPQNI